MNLTKSGQTIVYSYDDKGERILKKTTSVNEYYLRDHTGRELAIYDLIANRIKMANIFGNGLIGRVDVNYSQTSGWTIDENGNRVRYTYTVRSDDRNYYLKDHLGSNRMTINSLGVVTNVQDYYAYGEVLRSYNNSTPNEKYKFTGKERDTETDLDYFGARYYDSELGRWLSVDPLASKYPAWSPYNYCLNTPIKLIDKDGREPNKGPVDFLLKYVAKKAGRWLGKKLSNSGEIGKGFGKEEQDVDYDNIPDDQDEIDGRLNDPKGTAEKEKKSKEGSERLKRALEDSKNEVPPVDNDGKDDAKKQEDDKKKKEQPKPEERDNDEVNKKQK